MKRYILRHNRQAGTPQQDIKTIGAIKGMTIVDSSPVMLLVEAEAVAIEQVRSSLPDWSVSEEKVIPLPDTKKKPKGPS